MLWSHGMHAAFKIFDIGTDPIGTMVFPKTLFHGVKGSRKLPLDEVIHAAQKRVRDGSGQKYYLSGFYAYPTIADAVHWIRGAKHLDKRAVVQVFIDDIAWKPNAVRTTYLAQQLLIPMRCWEYRIPARDLLNIFPKHSGADSDQKNRRKRNLDPKYAEPDQ